MKRNFDELIREGILRLNGNNIVFDEGFRDGILEDTEIILRDGNCGGSQCETRDGIREAIESTLRSRNILDKRTIALCAELFLVEHGKTPAEILKS